jgi:hypothetical protein
MIKIRKHHLKKNMDKPFKLCLIFKSCNSWILGPELNQEAQLSTNLKLILKVNERILLKKSCKAKKKDQRKNYDKIC